MTSEQNFELARQLTCPVVVIAAPGPDNSYHAMVSTLSYASLDPLLFSTSVHRASRTGQAILDSGTLSVSLVAQRHLAAVQTFASVLTHKSDDDQTTHLPQGQPDGSDSLSQAGFLVEYFESSRLPYIADAVMSLDCRLVNKLALPQSTLIIFNVVASTVGKSVPLIRYNRSYATITSDLIAAQDAYPV